MTSRGSVRRYRLIVAAVFVVVCGAWASPARALDTDIFTGTQVDPNVLIVFDNSGSMGLQAYNTYPNTIYSGAYTAGTIYSRCANKSGVSGGDVNTNCTCKNVQTNWVIDNSSCKNTVVDLVPPPSGDDTDDRESRRKRGNRLNFETNPPKNCELEPFDSCTSNAQCPGFGNSCAVQNKMAVAQGVVTSLINDPANDNVRFGLMNFNPSGISYGSMNYGDSNQVKNWQQDNLNKFLFPVQDNTASARSTLTSLIGAMTANGGTPTVHRLIDAWKYFNGQVTKSGWTTSPVQYTCQRNYVLMVTDGIPEVEADYNTSPQTSCQFSRVKSFVGNPGDLNTDGKENPSDTTNYIAYTGAMFNCGSDYLDDAMIKIRGMFPLNNSQNQPLVLYAVSFGFDYCQPPAAGDLSPGGGSLLYRASKKYGGGECLSATDPDQLDDALREALNLIKNDAQSFVAPVVPVSQTNRTESGDRLYVALFAPREGQQDWPGNIKKYKLDRNNGTICNASSSTCTTGSGAATTADGTILGTAESFWDASTGGPSGSSVTAGGVGAVLQQSNLANRKIFTYTGTATGNLGGIPLTAAGQAFAKTNSALTIAMLGLTGADATAAERDKLIDFVYGFDSYDRNSNGNTTEKRSWILGDIIHSVPLIVNYDATGTNSLIIVGANDGMLHAFDDATGAEVWAFIPPDVLGNLNNLRPGESAEHPFFVDSSAKVKLLNNGTQKILVFGLGRGGRAYYGLDITSKTAPTLLWRINNTASGFAELGQTWSTPALSRAANGGSPVDVAVFGGGYDPYFDDPNTSAANTAAGAMGRTVYMVNLSTGGLISSGGVQTHAIPSDPLLFDVNGDGIFDRGYIGDMGGNMWRISDGFAMSKLFFTPNGQRIFYQPDAVINNGSVMVYFGTGDRSSPMSTHFTDRFYAVRDDGSPTLQESGLINVTNNVTQPGSTQFDTLLGQINSAHGWYITLGTNGEKVLSPPTVYFNVAFSTFIPSTQVCQAGGTARVYVVDPLVGGPTTDLAGTSGGGLGGGSSTGGGVGTGVNGTLVSTDRFVAVGQSIPTSLKVTFGDNETKAFFGVTKGGGIALQPLLLPQIASNVIPVSWRQGW